MRSNIRIGVIGKGSQYKRISEILKKKKFRYTLYKPNNKKYFDKKSFEILKKFNVIFILTPNKTHFNYLKLLSKNRYIFCEKPPVTNKNDLKKLEKFSHKKIYFNFNLRFSNIGQLLSETKKFKLGELLYGTIIEGHGLAFKKEYIKSWRANKKLCKTGVFEVSTVHWLDLLNYYFNMTGIKMLNLRNFLKKESSCDNAYCKIAFKNKSEVDIYSSYTSPLVKMIFLVFTNGSIEQNHNAIEVRGPAKNLDHNNFFIKPKLIKKIIISDVREYESSLEKSISYFLNHVKKNKSFKKKDFVCSLISNKLIL